MSAQLAADLAKNGTHGIRADGAPAVDTFLRLDAVKTATGLARSTIYQLMADQKFPRSVPLAGNAVGWSAFEIANWQKARIAARDQVAA